MFPFFFNVCIVLAAVARCHEDLRFKNTVGHINNLQLIWEVSERGAPPPTARLREFFLFASSERAASLNLFESFGDCFLRPRDRTLLPLAPALQDIALERMQKMTGIQV